MARATKKPAAKKAAPKETTAKKATAKQEVVKYTAKDVALTKVQQSSLNVIIGNQDRIEKAMHNMMDIAFNSGERLLKLKDEVQAKYGRVWKQWAEDNLPFGYPQASRYMKLASSPDQYALLDDSITSIEGAVKQIEHLKNPKAAKQRVQARKEREARKRSSVPAATAGIISNATIEEIQKCTDVQELRDLITLIHARIDEIQDGDVLDADATEPEDDDDIQDDINTALS